MYFTRLFRAAIFEQQCDLNPFVVAQKALRLSLGSDFLNAELPIEQLKRALLQFLVADKIYSCNLKISEIPFWKFKYMYSMETLKR